MVDMEIRFQNIPEKELSMAYALEDSYPDSVSTVKTSASFNGEKLLQMFVDFTKDPEVKAAIIGAIAAIITGMMSNEPTVQPSQTVVVVISVGQDSKEISIQSLDDLESLLSEVESHG